MKNRILKMACIVIVLVLMATALVGCNGGGDDITLVKNGKAQFNVVYSSADGASIRRAATSFVEALREVGVDVNDPISDKDKTEVTDCEILVGTSIQNRPEECVVLSDSLGENGYVIKAVGTRVVIAGGTNDGTKSALDKFRTENLGITEDTKSLTNVSVSGTLLDEFITNFKVVKFNINGNPIENFVIAYDFGTDENIAKACPKPERLSDAINGIMGIELEVKSIDNTSSEQNRIIIRLVDEAGDDGFRAYPTEKDFVIECAYYNLFDKAFNAFVSSEISTKKGTVELDEDYLYTYVVSSVKYSDFGAKGDGKTDDFDAIYNTHVFANQCGQKVVADSGAKYYIGNTIREGKAVSVPIMTDTDFGNASFTIDDRAEGVYDCRGTHIFTVMRDPDNQTVTLNEAEIKALAGTDDPQILRTYDDSGKLISGKIPWLSSKLTSDAMILLQNKNHKDYVRFGGNRDNGQTRAEMILVDRSGNIDSTTPVTFDFTDITKLSIYYTDDVPITIQGGRFYNNCCVVVEKTDFKNKYTSYGRGFLVNRSNTTMKGINHKMENEPARFVGGVDNKKQSYPYYGFIVHSYTYNSKAISCDLTGHKVYMEDKSGSTGANNVSMGTYDLIVQYSIGSYFERITQSRVPIHDSAYWGMMASNFSRNMTFKSCSMSRFDAHCGFWNADLIDCEFGQNINVVGGGTLNIIGTRRFVGNEFIQLRGDYGATFEGDVLIKDCVFDASRTYNSELDELYDQNSKESTAYVFEATVTNGLYGKGTKYEADYFTWDFGYKCYLPNKITFDNFVSHAPTTYIFNEIYDAHFLPQGDGDGVFEITKEIVFMNMPDANIDKYKNSPTSASASMVGAIKRTIVK